MCDRCLRMLGESEPMYGFRVADDEGKERVFKGHQGCVKEMTEMIQQIYGVEESTDVKANKEESIEDK